MKRFLKADAAFLILLLIKTTNSYQVLSCNGPGRRIILFYCNWTHFCHLILFHQWFLLLQRVTDTADHNAVSPISTFLSPDFFTLFPLQARRFFRLADFSPRGSFLGGGQSDEYLACSVNPSQCGTWNALFHSAQESWNNKRYSDYEDRWDADDDFRARGEGKTGGGGERGFSKSLSAPLPHSRPFEIGDWKIWWWLGEGNFKKKWQNVFVSNSQKYLSQISKCICLKFPNIFVSNCWIAGDWKIWRP